MENNHESQDNVSQAGDKSGVRSSGTQQEKPANPDEITEHHNKKPQRMRDLGIQDRAMIWLTLGILVIGGVTAKYIRQQFIEMSSQTDILATQIQGDAASASIRALQAEKQLAIAQQQARAAQTQAKAAQDSANAILQQTEIGARPWLEISEIALAGGISINMNGESRSTVHIVAQNIGKTPAREVSLMVELVERFNEHQEVKRLCTMGFVSTKQMGKYGQVLFPTDTLGKDENQSIGVKLKPLTLVERKPAGTGYSESLRLDKNGPPLSQDEIIFSVPSSVIGCVQYKSFTSDIPYYTGFTYGIYPKGKDIHATVYNVRFDRKTGEATTSPSTTLKGNGNIAIPFEWIGLIPNRGWGNDVVK